MMKRVVLLLAIALMAAPLHAGFDEVSAALESQLGRSTWIPFFGVARAFVRVTHPDGVHDVQLAVFEDKGNMDPKAGEELMNSRIGGGFTPMVKSRSRHDWSYIYARPAGDKLELVILTNDGSDTVLIRVVADPEAVSRIQRDPQHVHVTFSAGK